MGLCVICMRQNFKVDSFVCEEKELGCTKLSKMDEQSQLRGKLHKDSF